MPITNFILRYYGPVIEIIMWLLIFGSGFVVMFVGDHGDWHVGKVIAAGIAASIAAFIICVIVFAPLLLIVDIQQSVRALHDVARPEKDEELDNADPWNTVTEETQNQ